MPWPTNQKLGQKREEAVQPSQDLSMGPLSHLQALYCDHCQPWMLCLQWVTLAFSISRWVGTVSPQWSRRLVSRKAVLQSGLRWPA